ncbi:DMT family transporter [Azospira restricta]|uniref:DMT family transporter n=1 Tax=Azospira restricta TaxID=404405 RepID=A0A974PVZ4_9RHOO|nr:DMT family transporter [Azospira restricta]QRJ62522.1 DMT family transporter [Azospira restricta]
MNSRHPPGASAFALMILLCAIWGFQQVTIKIAIDGISPVLQSGIRSLVGLALLMLWARWRGLPLLQADGTARLGLLAGALFAVEFVFIYAGLAHTTASRMIVFLYTAPCLTVLGLHWCVPGERLHWRHFAGIALAFAGITAGFLGESGSAAGTFLGDLLGLLAAVGWAATTVLIRASGLSRISASKVLGYQLAVSAVVMLPLSPLLGEAGITRLSLPVLLALAYQGVIVAFASYLAWFWLLQTYLVGRLMVFSFLTPLFGVAFGVLFLDDPLTPSFLLAAGCVAAGIVLVNLPQGKKA